MDKLGKIKVVREFPPLPDKLVLRERDVEVTQSPSQRSVDYFIHKAAKLRGPYRREIRALVHADAKRKAAGGTRN